MTAAAYALRGVHLPEARRRGGAAPRYPGSLAFWLEPATTQPETGPAGAHEPPVSLFQVFSARERSPAPAWAMHYFLHYLVPGDAVAPPRSGGAPNPRSICYLSLRLLNKIARAVPIGELPAQTTLNRRANKRTTERRRIRPETQSDVSQSPRANPQLYCKRWHGLRYRRSHFALVVSIDILTRETPQRATHCGASTYIKRATGFEPATLSLGTCPASAHERQRALFRVFSARGRSPALVGVALLSALPRRSVTQYVTTSGQWDPLPPPGGGGREGGDGREGTRPGRRGGDAPRGGAAAEGRPRAPPRGGGGEKTDDMSYGSGTVDVQIDEYPHGIVWAVRQFGGSAAPDGIPRRRPKLRHRHSPTMSAVLGWQRRSGLRFPWRRCACRPHQ